MNIKNFLALPLLTMTICISAFAGEISIEKDEFVAVKYHSKTWYELHGDVAIGKCESISSKKHRFMATGIKKEIKTIESADKYHCEESNWEQKCSIKEALSPTLNLPQIKESAGSEAVIFSSEDYETAEECELAKKLAVYERVIRPNDKHLNEQFSDVESLRDFLNK